MVRRFSCWNKFRSEYKSFPIGKPLPQKNMLSCSFLWDSTPQGHYYWHELASGHSVFTVQDYNNIASFYNDPLIEDSVNIEDCM